MPDIEWKQPWAILPQALEERAQNRETARVIPHTGADEDRDYEIRDRIAILPIEGGLIKSGWSWGMTATYSDIGQAVQQADADPSVAAILLNIDSPGGTVAGVEALSEILQETQKPLYAYTDSMMASAAYWIGSHAKRIGAANTAQIGSIGVLLVHGEMSKMLDEIGIKYTFLTAGDFKAAGNMAEPLSDRDREYFQTRLQGIYTIFLETVAANRDFAPGTEKQWADGRVFLAGDARNLGLIDDAGLTLNQFIELIKEEEGLMTRDEFRVKHPELYEQIRANAKEEVYVTLDQIKADAAKEGATAAIAAAEAIYGADAQTKISALVDAGLSAEKIRAMAQAGLIQKAEAPTAAPPTTHQQLLDAYRTQETPVGVQPVTGEPSQGEDPVRAFEGHLTAHLQKHPNQKRNIAIWQVGQRHPDLKEKWLEAQQT